MAAEVLSGSTVNQVGLTAVTNAVGDSTVVRSFRPGSRAKLLSAWALNATAGQHRVRSPRLHDNVNNLLVNVKAANGQPLYNEWICQDLFSQDTLTVELSGGGAETDTESILVWYEDVPGLDARLYMPDDIKARFEHFVTLTFAVVSGVTLGTYVGTTAFSAATGNLRANLDYAIIGYETSVACTTIGVRGPDTGNARIGGPGTVQALESRRWFAQQSLDNGVPLVPVFNSANIGGTFLDIVQNGANTNPTVTLILALLRT
jgi:hypothetical protein